MPAHYADESVWPAGWKGADPDRWPSLHPARWTPERCGHAVLTCLRTGSAGDPHEMTVWVDAAEGAEALRVLCAPTCGPRCQRQHVLAWTTVGAVHAVRGPHDPDPVPRPRWAALIAAGYHRPRGRLHTPVPLFNPPLR